MLVVQDFTRLPEGTTIALEGSVGRCPTCGRNGIPRKRVDGSTSFLHVQTTEMFGDGMRTDPKDRCLFPAVTRA